jgi:phage terminase Nu1 subunit (DNA packaging protein)
MLKADLTELTLAQLSDLTGKHYKTLKRRLAGLKPVRRTGNAIFYDPTEALPLIYSADYGSQDPDEDLDPRAHQNAVVKARARYENARADTEELKAAKMKGELILASQAEKAWAGCVIACRTKLLSLDARVVSSLTASLPPETLTELAAGIREVVHEALTELSQHRAVIPDPDAEDLHGDDGAASEDDDQSVGGEVP